MLWKSTAGSIPFASTGVGKETVVSILCLRMTGKDIKMTRERSSMLANMSLTSIMMITAISGLVFSGMTWRRYTTSSGLNRKADLERFQRNNTF